MKYENILAKGILEGDHRAFELATKANKEASIMIDQLARLQARVKGEISFHAVAESTEELVSKVNYHAEKCVSCCEAMRKEYGMKYDRYYDFSSRYEKVLLAQYIQETFLEFVAQAEGK